MTLDRWYRGRRVLVTGHTGFKGSWLSAWLTDIGADVTGYARAPEAGRPSLFVDSRIETKMRSEIGELTDAPRLTEVVANATPEIIFHLAAQSLVRRSYRDPLETFRSNVMGTAQLLEVVRRAPSVRAVVVVTSDKCYANDGSGAAYPEDRRMGGDDPYSASKGCTELLVAAWRVSYRAEGIPALATARAGNVIGGGDWAEDRLIPDLVRAAIRGESTPIRNPDSTRPWQHVLEPLHGYLMLGRRLAESGHDFAEGWNFGPRAEDAVPVREVVRLMHRFWDRVVTEEAPSPGPSEARLLALDCAKAGARLGWHPRMTLEHAVERTAQWYRRWHESRSQTPALVASELQWYRTNSRENVPI